MLDENLCLTSSMIKNSRKFGSTKNKLENYRKKILVTFDQLLEYFSNIQYSLRFTFKKTSVPSWSTREDFSSKALMLSSGGDSNEWAWLALKTEQHERNQGKDK